jgi:hypothetical protein
MSTDTKTRFTSDSVKLEVGKVPIRNYVKLVATHDSGCPIIPLKTYFGGGLIQGANVEHIQLSGLDYVVLRLNLLSPATGIIEAYMRDRPEEYSVISTDDKRGSITCIVKDELVTAVLKPKLHSKLLDYRINDGKNEYGWFNGRPSEAFELGFDTLADVERFKREVLPEVHRISPD